MRKCTIASAIAAAALFGLTAIADTPASAQNVVDVSTPAVDPSVVQPGSDRLELRPPMAALGSEYATPTQYAPDGRVTLRIGDYILAFLGAIGAGLTTWLTATLNGWLNKKADADRARMISEWTARAVNAAANYVAGAAPGMTVSFAVGSEWVERALEQSLDLFGGLVMQTGGEASQRRRIWSYIKLDPAERVPGVAPIAIDPVKAATPPPAPPVKARA